MFRGVNLKNSSVDNIKFTLMKNINEEYAEIPKDFVTNINWKHRDCSTMTLEIPNKRLVSGKQIDENLYNMFLGKYQQIIVELGDVKERYIVTQCTREIEFYKGENGEEIPYKVKKLECKSYEFSLSDKKFIASEDLSRQLYYSHEQNKNTEAVDIADGYLNFLEQDTNWKVKHVSELARKEFSKAYNEFYININDVTILNMTKGTTIWEQDFNITPVGKNVVNLKALYTHIQTFDSNGKILIDDKKVHDTNLNTIYTGVKHIKAIYDGNEDYRYAIHYVITLIDGEVINRWEDLNLFLDNQKVVFKGIVLAYEDGSEGETSLIKNRTVEAGTYKYLDFLRNTVENAFNIILIFDTYNMTVSAYDKTEVGENKGLELSYNFIKSINKKDGYDEVINKLIVASDNTSIVDENPFGTDYILDYSYHYDNDLMSEELKSSWDRYLKHIDGKQTELFELRLDKNTYNKRLIQQNAELTQLNLAIRDLQTRRVDYQKKNADRKGLFDVEIRNMSEQINTKQDKASGMLKDVQSIKDSIASIDVKIKNILKDISLDGATDDKGLIFTKDLLLELDSITVEDELQDSFYTVSLGLFNYAREKMNERNKLKIEFSLTVCGLLQNIIIPKGVNWNYYLNVSDFVPLIDGEEDIKSDDERGLRIVEIDYSPREFNISKITLSNSEKTDDDWKGASNIGHAINKNSNFINNYKPTIQNSVTVNDYINTMLTDGLDASATAIRSRNNRVVYEETEAGFFIEDGFDNNKQLYIGASIIAFTNDRFLTSKCAISDEGITADYLIGRMILGKTLYICNSNSDGSISDEFYIGNIDKNTHEPSNNGENFGLRISENNVERIMLGIEKDTDGIRRAKLRLRSASGNHELVITEDGIINQNEFLVGMNISPETDCEMIIPIKVDEGTNEMRKCILTLIRQKYKTYSRGVEAGGAILNTTTTDSGGSYVSSVTSEGGGAFNISRTTENNYAGKGTDLYGGMTENAENMGIGQSLIDAINSGNATLVNTLVSNHTHMLSHFNLIHVHNVEIKQDAHSHSVSISVPSHHHNLTLSVPAHSHPQIIGVNPVNSYCSNIRIEVNGQIVAMGINNDSEVDITSYIKLNTTNIVKVYSTTHGFLYVHVYEKRFVSY